MSASQSQLLPRGLAAGALLALLAGGARAAAAQANGSGEGYLFGRPVARFTIRGGYDRPNARGGVYDEFSQRLTLGSGSYGGGTVNGELAFSLSDRLDLALGAGYASSSRGSEFRHFTNQDDSPITQTTSLQRVPLTVGLKAYLAPRGRTIGRLAYIPSHFAPYVSVGGGAIHYSLEQEGHFVDDNTLNIFTGDLRSRGWASAGYGAVGADLTLSPRVVATTELRYTVARGTLGGDFQGFDNISLSGVGLTAGLGFRF